MATIRIGDRIVNTNHYSDIYFYEDEETKPCIRGLTPFGFLRTLYTGPKKTCLEIIDRIHKKDRQ